jgi:hypothetical protein
MTTPRKIRTDSRLLEKSSRRLRPRFKLSVLISPLLHRKCSFERCGWEHKSLTLKTSGPDWEAIARSLQRQLVTVERENKKAQKKAELYKFFLG